MRGILLPTTTPFTDAQELDIEASVSNIRKWARTGITGFVMLGSTGERVHLDEREYVRVLETARNEVPAELAFIAGAGQHSTVGTIREIQKAADLGVDAVLVITPHYYRSAITQDALVSYYTAVADAAPVPVLLYSMPAFTGIKIEPETIARLSEHPNIIGVKDSSNDVAGFAATVRVCPADFAVLTGNGTVLLDALRAGGNGRDPRRRLRGAGDLRRNLSGVSNRRIEERATRAAKQTHASRSSRHDAIRHRRPKSRPRPRRLPGRRRSRSFASPDELDAPRLWSF